jgi:hypothetical protein
MPHSHLCEWGNCSRCRSAAISEAAFALPANVLGELREAVTAWWRQRATPPSPAAATHATVQVGDYQGRRTTEQRRILARFETCTILDPCRTETARAAGRALALVPNCPAFTLHEAGLDDAVAMIQFQQTREATLARTYPRKDGGPPAIVVDPRVPAADIPRVVLHEVLHVKFAGMDEDAIAHATGVLERRAGT